MTSPARYRLSTAADRQLHWRPSGTSGAPGVCACGVGRESTAQAERVTCSRCYQLPGWRAEARALTLITCSCGEAYRIEGWLRLRALRFIAPVATLYGARGLEQERACRRCRALLHLSDVLVHHLQSGLGL